MYNQSTQWQDLPILEVNYLEMVAMGDKEIIKELLMIFHQDTADRIITLSQAIDSGEEEVVFRMLHTIKGASAQVGACQVEAISFELENDARKGLFSDIRDALPQLSAAFKILSAELDKRGYL